jgi:hypothetical protein
MPVAGTKFHFLQRLHENGPRNGSRARTRASCGGVIRPHDLPGCRCPLPARETGLLAAARGCAQPGTGSGRDQQAPRCWLRTWRPHRPTRPPVRGGGRSRPRPGDARRRSPSRPRTGHHEHRLGPSRGRGPPGGGTGAVPSGDLRSVLPLDGRSPCRRGRVRHVGARHVGARRRLGPDRPHRRGSTAPPSPGPPPIPHAEIKVLVETYLGSTRRAGQGTTPVQTHRFEDVLVRTRFGASRAIFAPGIPDPGAAQRKRVVRLRIQSSSAPHLFGDRVEDFASEVRTLLRSRSPEGIFWDWPGDTEVILARKPG